jgi:hypothetical protein
MDLKQFVAETLGQIVEGVAEASKNVQGVGDAAINPRRSNNAGLNSIHSSGALIVSVEFTVALSVSEDTGTKGGIGVVAGIFAVGSHGESKEAKASTTHVHFSVPVALPTPRSS